MLFSVFISSSEILVVRDPNNPNANRNDLPFPLPGVGSANGNDVSVSKGNMFGHPALASLFAGMQKTIAHLQLSTPFGSSTSHFTSN